MSSFTATTELRPDRQLLLTIQPAPEEVQRELRKAANKVAGQYRIPGFRKGKAPYHIIVQQFGLANLYSEFVDDMGQQLFMEAIEREGIKPYAQSSLADIKLEPLTFQLLVPLEPEVKLGDYRSLRMEKPAPAVDEAAVDARINQLLEEYSSWGAVDRPSQYGDLMTIDVRSVIPASADGGDEILVLDETDWDVTPDQENPMEPPGFDEELLGLKTGDTKEFVLGWPADSQSIYAGKEATFTVSVTDVEAYDKPALDDDFAQLVGPDFATLDDLKRSIRESLEADQASSAQNKFVNDLLDAVVAMSELNYPPVVIADQIDGMVQETDQRLRQMGIDGIESFLQRTGQSMEQYRAGIEPQAKEIALRNLVLSEIIRAEQLRVSDEELAARAARIASQDFSEVEDSEEVEDIEDADEADTDESDIEATDDTEDTGEADAGGHGDEINSVVEFFTQGGGRNMLLSQMLTEKAIDRVLAIARGEEIPALATDNAPTVADDSATAGSAADAASA